MGPLPTSVGGPAAASPPLTLNLWMSESAGSRSLPRLVRCRVLLAQGLDLLSGTWVEGSS